MKQCDLSQYFNPDQEPSPYIVIVLNQAITVQSFQLLYSRANLKVCADGGYNRLQEWGEASGYPYEAPDYIIGDLDSIDYDNAIKIPKVIKDNDQNRTDLQKCIEFTSGLNMNTPQTFILIGALGGRLDHELLALSTLYQYVEHQIIALNEKSLLTLIKDGVSTVTCYRKYLGPHCGYAPFKSSSIISTSGLKWDVDDKETELGAFISTSNEILGDSIWIKSFNLGLQKFKADMSARKNFAASSEDALIVLANLYLRAEYIYQAGGSWAQQDLVTLPGFSQLFRKNRDIKLENANRVYAYISQRGGRSSFPPIPAPALEFKSAHQVLRACLTMEKEIMQQLILLHQNSEVENDPSLEQFTEHDLIPKQTEFIKQQADFITELVRSGVEGLGLYLFDQDLND